MVIQIFVEGIALDHRLPLPGLEKAWQRSSAAGRKVPKKHRNGVRLADFWSKADVLE